ncbi:MAG: small-conductance mechanosensitive channel [Cytophagaceae bacterium]|jgi:small-conductance mechanosensitive channel|nr:small-conductance mechanosensitive channel [Cytophagaceae bacterium]
MVKQPTHAWLYICISYWSSFYKNMNLADRLQFLDLNPWLLFGLSVLASFVFSYLLYFIFSLIIRRFFKSSKSKVNKELRTSFHVLVVVAALKIGYSVVSLPYTHWDARLDKILSITLIVALTLFIYRFIGFSRSLFYSHLEGEQEEIMYTRKARTQVEFLFKMAAIIVWLIGISAILMSFEGVRNFGTSILASAGIAGIIIGLAAQRSISNLFAGMQIAFTQPIKIDDALIVENEFGTVEEISLTYVVVKLWDSRRMVFPISYFIEKPFQNWTRASSDLLGSVFLYVDYSFPVEEGRKELKRILSLDEAKILWDGRVSVLQVTDANERTFQLRILISSIDAPTTFNLRVFIREKMIAFIQENYPQSLPKQRIEYSRAPEHAKFEN